MRSPRLIYFSLNPGKRDSFIKEAQQHKDDFRVIDIYKDFEVNHVSDLFYVLDNKVGDLRRLYIVIDYLSLCQTWDSLENNSEYIRKVILQYPEINFLFDESQDNKKYDFQDFLFLGVREQQIYNTFHKYISSDGDPFKAIKYNFDNIYDASKLRYAVKLFNYSKLKVKKHNFQKSQEQRRDNLAICIEEESSQNRFNSYAMYANGMRVIPVMTAHMLNDVNELMFGSPKIVLRDYDLQFSDAREDDSALKGKVREGYHLVDMIRGAQYKEKEQKWTILTDKVDDNGPNTFWNNIAGTNSNATFFITKGRENLEFTTPDKDKYKYFEIDKGYLFISGLKKPVAGIYTPFHSLKGKDSTSIISQSYANTRQKLYQEDEKKHKNDNYEIITDRENHNHGIPLDLYDMVRDMIDRASKYYENEKFVHAAIISNEAIEVMNGFHQTLMIKAYHLHAKAENAIAMNSLGGDETQLTKDTQFRIDKIDEDVKRLLYHSRVKNDNNAIAMNSLGGDKAQLTKDTQFRIDKNDNNDFLARNILNQIYSDCRSFCQEKEHFDAENLFIGAMGRLNEKYGWTEIKDDLRAIINLIYPDKKDEQKPL